MDTAQPEMAAETDPNAQLGNAADAFKAFLNPAQLRDETGRFASTEQPEETAEEAEHETELVEGEAEDGDEADEEATEQVQPLPPSWGAEDAGLWESLPPDARAKIAAREGERDRGLSLKLQETANARKEASLAAQESQTRRAEYLNALETVEGLYTVQKPDPRAFGYGTQQYNAAAYATAHAEYEQAEQVLAQIRDQRDTIQKQAQEEEAQAFTTWKQQHEAEFAPKFVADVPDLTDPAKAEPLMRDLVNYAIASGIPDTAFSEDEQKFITSAQLHILWKAQQFDKLKSAKVEPKPRQANPAIRPGVSSPRSAQKAARHQQAFDRLAREGSIEAGAAVFKNLFKG